MLKSDKTKEIIKHIKLKEIDKNWRNKKENIFVSIFSLLLFMLLKQKKNIINEKIKAKTNE